MIENFISVFDETIIRTIGWGILETFYMVLGATLLAYVVGLPTGMLLIMTGRRDMRQMPRLNAVLNFIVNILRSVPFLILFLVLMPFVRLLVGKAYGPTAAMVALFIAAAPFVARLVEQSLQEVDGGVIEAAFSMGASPATVLWKVMLPEALPSLANGCTIATTTILGYSAMAGFVASGGLGDIAVRYGFNRWVFPVLLVCVILLVIIVQIMQEVGMRLTKKVDKRNVG